MLGPLVSPAATATVVRRPAHRSFTQVVRGNKRECEHQPVPTTPSKCRRLATWLGPVCWSEWSCSWVRSLCQPHARRHHQLDWTALQAVLKEMQGTSLITNFGRATRPNRCASSPCTCPSFILRGRATRLNRRATCPCACPRK